MADNKIVVKFRQHHGSYNAGEIAGFSPRMAERLVEILYVADYYESKKRDVSQKQTKPAGGETKSDEDAQQSSGGRKRGRSRKKLGL